MLTLRKFEAMDTEIIASRLNLDLDGAKNLINEWNIGMLSCPNKQASFKTITAKKSRMQQRSGFLLFTFSLFTKIRILDFWKVIGNSE